MRTPILTITMKNTSSHSSHAAKSAATSPYIIISFFTLVNKFFSKNVDFYDSFSRDHPQNILCTVENTFSFEVQNRLQVAFKYATAEYITGLHFTYSHHLIFHMSPTHSGECHLRTIVSPFINNPHLNLIPHFRLLH